MSDTGSLPTTEEVYGKSAADLVAEGKARWEAEKAGASPGKEPWELVAFKPDPAVVKALSAPTKDEDARPGDDESAP